MHTRVVTEGGGDQKENTTDGRDMKNYMLAPDLRVPLRAD